MTEIIQRTYKIFMDAIDSPGEEVDRNGNIAVHATTYAVWTTKIPEEGRSGLTEVDRPGE